MKRIAIVADRQGWCWWWQATALKKWAPADVDVDLFVNEEIHNGALNHYDAALIMSWNEGNTRTTTRKVSLAAHEGIMHEATKSVMENRPAEVDAADWRPIAATRLRNRWTFADRALRYDAFIAVSRRLHAYLQQESIPATYCPAGVDIHVFRPAAKDFPRGDQLRVGWCGQHKPDSLNVKGYHWLLEPLMERCEGLPIHWDALVNTPQQAASQREMAKWYRTLDVFLCTSISEGTPMPVLEAMASGVPVISTVVGDVPELADGEAVVQAGQYHDEATRDQVLDCMVEQLRAYAGDRELTRLHGEKARRLAVCRRSWSTLAPTWIKAILS